MLNYFTEVRFQISFYEKLVVTSAYGRPPALTDPGGGGGESQGNWTGRRRMPSFLGGKSRGAFGQLVFFLAESRMTTLAFDEEVF